MRDPRDLFVACCVPASAAATARIRSALTAGCDWERLLELAGDHGLVPLVCRRVLDAAADQLGPAALDRLGAASRASAARALFATGQLAEVIGALDAAGVAALPYKGPALALDAYADVALRESDDLDVVVAPADFTAAAGALESAGYSPQGASSWREARVVHDWQGHVPSSGAGERLPVELHWRFCDRKLPWSPHVHDVMARATWREIAGVQIRIPELHDQLLLVLLHAARHGWDRLEPLACVAALIGRGIDAGVLLERAREVGGERASLTGLALTARVLGIVLPEPLRHAIERGGGLPNLVDAAELRLGRGDAGATRDAELHLRMLDDPVARARYVALHLALVTPRDRAVVALPPWASPLYVPIRIIRLAGRAITG